LDPTDPLGVMWLSANLKRHGHQSKLFIPNLESDMKQKIIDYAPDMIAYSVTSGSEQYYLAMDKAIQKIQPHFTLFGGPHPTYFPDVIKEAGLDASCQGEGDDVILDVVNALESGGDVAGIPNISVMRDGEVIKNEVRNYIEDLDTLPFPDRDILMKYPAYKNYGVRFFLASRGCPYLCTYCFNHAAMKLYKDKGKYVRHRSVGNVIEEVHKVWRDYGMRHVYFYDDIFVLDRKWFAEFAEVYRKEIGMPYTCYLRVNLVDEDLVRLLKESGCRSIAMAVESGNAEIREKILKRKMTNDQIIDTVQLLQKHDIHVMTQNMVGMPNETVENALETIDLNMKAQPSYAWCSIFQPYIGTDLHDYCEELGLIDESWKHNHNEGYQDDTPINTGDIKHQFENLHKLFGLAVEFPFLIPYLKFLIKLPKNMMFELLYRGFKGYTHFFRMRMSSFDFSFFKYIKRVFKYRRKLKKKGDLFDVTVAPTPDSFS